MKLQLPGIHSRLYGELSKNKRNHLIFGVEICRGREAKNMNIPTSEGNSSGCESGWTMYLDHSADNRHQLQKHGSTTTTVGYDEDDEDLSMVSDASSGPPNFHEDDQLYSSFDHESGYNFAYGSSASQQARQEGKKINKNKNQHGKDKQLCLPSYLDDTASSPIKASN
ncbi:protein SOB FIVE-LIKE 5-like [Diospyros lotus]|uniref:protein SOB FIVE-LIKE 5-like n=1 Tax=Diospyros lotus TaxID=55363 RepID=UPI002256CDC2|nr:protein SOB FIVE-LIKE 5-like [Diospyros lotus]